VDKFRKRIAQLHEQRSEIDLQIRTLEESCARLEAQIEVQVKEARKSGTPAAAAAKPAKTKKLEKAIV
jgi:predicted  nucleic acid-binding Zn-ribbon protein